MPPGWSAPSFGAKVSRLVEEARGINTPTSLFPDSIPFKHLMVSSAGRSQQARETFGAAQAGGKDGR